MLHRIGRVEVPSVALSRPDLEQRFTVVAPQFGVEPVQRVESYADVMIEPAAVMFYVEVETRADHSNDFVGTYSTQQALEEIKQCRGRPALYEELLGYYGHWERFLANGESESWMRLTVALASFVPFSGKRATPVLARNQNFLNLPDLRLCDDNGPWPAGTRFLAIR
jgi:hypothetical protein